METKKSFKADLRNKRSLFLEIGMLVALSLVVVAFNYTPKELGPKKEFTATSEYVGEEIPPVVPDVPQQKLQKIHIPKSSDILVIVDNDRHIKTDFIFDDIDENTIIDIPHVKVDVIEDDTPVHFAEIMPSFMDGDLNTFRAWVMQNVKFPQVALDNRIFGKVVLSFVIDKEGRLTNIEVLQTPDRSLSEEAIRVLNKSPKWKPGKQNSKTVRVKYTLPVEFSIKN